MTMFRSFRIKLMCTILSIMVATLVLPFASFAVLPDQQQSELNTVEHHFIVEKVDGTPVDPSPSTYTWLDDFFDSPALIITGDDLRVYQDTTAQVDCLLGFQDISSVHLKDLNIKTAISGEDMTVSCTFTEARDDSNCVIDFETDCSFEVNNTVNDRADAFTLVGDSSHNTNSVTLTSSTGATLNLKTAGGCPLYADNLDSVSFNGNLNVNAQNAITGYVEGVPGDTFRLNTNTEVNMNSTGTLSFKAKASSGLMAGGNSTKFVNINKGTVIISGYGDMEGLQFGATFTPNSNLFKIADPSIKCLGSTTLDADPELCTEEVVLKELQPGAPMYTSFVNDEIAKTLVVSIPEPFHEYKMTEGENAAIDLANLTDVVFRSEADFSKFVGVSVDEQMLTRDVDYVATEGSTIATVKADYLKTLSVGEHSLSILSNDGAATTSFSVIDSAVTEEEATATGSSTQTGDDFAFGFSFALLMMIGIVGTAIFTSCKNN